ncbi:MAG: histidine phosphatase family protein [Candidatus Pacebacteria bacterium]|nr:histidine phosphatase family protein [Candidatus Paceibacterota bacterium]
MKVYFVRHGESEYNVLYLHQHEKVGLSEKGIKQAKILAKRFSKIPINIIYSSPLKRAKQTVEIINKTVKKKIIYSDFLKERKRPSEFLGKKADSSEVLKIHEIINPHDNDPLWHYSDEENFIEFKKRVKKFFDVLAKTKKENILVVTHGGPIKILVLTMMLGDELTPEIFRKFADLFELSNTGITLCEKNEKGKWIVRVFNDHTHLG